MNKTIFYVMFCIILIVSLPIAISLEISGFSIEEGPATAKVKWKTDEDADSRIFYGVDDLNKKKEDLLPKKDHELILNDINAADTYKVIANSCIADECVNSTMQEFSLAEEELLIDAEIPSTLTVKEIDIIGTTKKNTQIKLYKNNALDRQVSSSNGNFRFANVRFETDGDYILRIEVDDGQEVFDQTYDIYVDTASPVLNIDMPDTAITSDFYLTGTVNEQSLIRAYLEPKGDIEQNIPKVEGFIVRTSDKNSVELLWEQSNYTAFGKYIIYRKDVGAIAATYPRSYNTFTDLLVNSDVEYQYQIAIMDVYGNLGPKSDWITVNTKPDGRTDIKAPDKISLNAEKTAAAMINTTGSFRLDFKSIKDGLYTMRIEAVDNALNKQEIKNDFLVNTKGPAFSDISPLPGTFIYDVNAKKVDISGKTTPSAKVKLRVNTTGYDKIDYEETADEEGFFKFDNIDITKFFNRGFEPRQVPLTNVDDDLGTRNYFDDPSRAAKLLLEATDSYGRKASYSLNYRIGSCWSGNFSFDIVPLTRYQSPTLLSTERIAEGTEVLYFYLNFSYIGQGTDPQIESISLQKACDDYIVGDPRYNVSCKIMQDGCTKKANSDRTLWYFACPLKSMPDMDRWVEDDWDSFFDSFSNEMVFPYSIRIGYSHEVQDYSYDPISYNEEIVDMRRTEYQTICQPITYVVDSSRIDFRNVFPDWLLYDTVDWLESSIEKLTEAMDKIEKILKWLGIGCVVSYLVKFVTTVMRRFSCFMEGVKDNPLGDATEAAEMVGLNLGVDDKPKCPLMEDQDKLTNVELEERCPGCYAAWERESKLYKTYRSLCDRVFCHTAPAAWTEYASDKDLIEKEKEETNACGDDQQSVRGAYLVEQKCSGYDTDLMQDYLIESSNNKCYAVDIRKDKDRFEREGYVMVLSPDSQQYTNQGYYKFDVASSKREIGRTEFSIYAKDVGGIKSKYLYASPLTCEEECARAGFDNKKVDDGWACVQTDRCMSLGMLPGSRDSFLESRGDSKEHPDYFSYVGKSELDKDGDPEFEYESDKDYSTFQAGYTADCYLGAGLEEYDGEIYMNDPTKTPATYDDRSTETMIECCCYSTGERSGSDYYAAESVRAKNKFDADYDSGEYSGELSPEEARKLFQEDELVEQETDDGVDKFPPFNYRYNMIGIRALNDEADVELEYKAKDSTTEPQAEPVEPVKPDDNADKDKEKEEKPGRLIYAISYNPNRYIKDRDWAGCFGQRTVWLSGENKIMHDPFSNHISAFQCLCVSGIYNRLKILVNIMRSLRNCLVDLRTSGLSDSGYCKEMFSQYVCGLLWRVITYLKDGCLPWGKGIDLGQSESSLMQTVKGGTQAVFGGIQESQNEIAREYGNAQLNNLLGTGEEAVARKVCLAAFGYDWELSMENVLDAAYSTPYASLVQKMSATREYLTFDAFSAGQSRYEYRSSWVVNPGCDLDDYDIFLSCVSLEELDKPGVDCSAQGDPLGSNCDCLNLGNEITRKFYDGGPIDEGTFDDRDFHDIIYSPYRYDHLKFVLRADARIEQDEKGKCFGENHKNGVYYFPLRDITPRDMLACQVEPASGQFICGSGMIFDDMKGGAYMQSILINDEKASNSNIIYAKDGLYVTPTVWMAPGPEKCLMIEVSVDGVNKAPSYMRVFMPNTHEYAPVQLLSPDDIQSLARVDWNYPSGIDFVARNAQETTKVSLMFADFGEEGIQLTSDSEDTVTIDNADEKSIAQIVAENDGRLVIETGGAQIEVRRVVLDPGQKSKTFDLSAKKRAITSDVINARLKLALVNLKAEQEDMYSPEDCNEYDIVNYNGKEQVQDYSITIRGKTELDEKRCDLTGWQINTQPCYCEDDINEGVYDCGKGKDVTGQYCYANEDVSTHSCHEFPLCQNRNGILENKFECDCDADGIVKPAAEDSDNSDCHPDPKDDEGKAIGTPTFYCNAETKKCSSSPNGKDNNDPVVESVGIFDKENENIRYKDTIPEKKTVIIRVAATDDIGLERVDSSLGIQFKAKDKTDPRKVTYEAEYEMQKVPDGAVLEATFTAEDTSKRRSEPFKIELKNK